MDVYQDREPRRMPPKRPELKGMKGIYNKQMKPILFQVPADVPLREVQWKPDKKIRSSFWGGLLGLALLSVEYLIDMPGLVPGWLEPILPLITGLLAGYRRKL